MLAQRADQVWHLGDRAATETPDPQFTHLAWRAGSAAATTENPEGGDR